MMETRKELLFVYNADSSIFSSIADLLHKSFKPDTYRCNLCKLTYGATMKREWKEFLDSLPYAKRFLHKDEFVRLYPDSTERRFPAIYFNSSSLSPQPLVSAEEIDAVKNLDELKSLLSKKIA